MATTAARGVHAPFPAFERHGKPGNGVNGLKQMRLLGRIMKHTGASKVMLGFVAFVLLCALVIWLHEPGIATYGDALWYCFTALSTIGFGDVVVTTRLSRVLTIILSIYAAAALAIFTAVIVNYFQEVIAQGRGEEIQAFFKKAERLPELSREELEQLAEQARKWRK